MKTRTVICLITLATIRTLFAQGTINFVNLVMMDGVRIVDAPVRYYDGSLLSGSDFVAQLYAGQTFGSLAPVGLPTPFLTGSQAGYFSGGTRTIDWIQPGGTVAFVQVKVWKLATGVTYEVASQRTASVLMTIQTGGLNGAPPANLIGLQPFGFAVPEPSTWLLLSIGGLALFYCRHQRK